MIRHFLYIITAFGLVNWVGWDFVADTNDYKELLGVRPFGKPALIGIFWLFQFCGLCGWVVLHMFLDDTLKEWEEQTKTEQAGIIIVVVGILVIGWILWKLSFVVYDFFFA